MRTSAPTSHDLGRRAFLGAIAAGAAGAALGSRQGSAAPPPANMAEKKIPRTGEALPVIGLGTYDTFDVGDSAAERAPLIEVMRRFAAAGGRVIDSSPMYGRSETVVGDVIAAAGVSAMFLATKVWTTGKAAAEEQMRTSMRRMRAARIDLMQIHNLEDWRGHLATLREWKAAGRIRYLGVTHYSLGAFAELEAIIRKEQVDFVQLPYSPATREAEKRLLPAAADHQTAVLVMRPFEKGGLFARVRGRPLPAWAAEIDCRSWAQLFLKFIVSHPAVTCAIPATADPAHLTDDVAAGAGRMPTAEQRERIAAAI